MKNLYTKCTLTLIFLLSCLSISAYDFAENASTAPSTTYTSDLGGVLDETAQESGKYYYVLNQVDNNVGLYLFNSGTDYKLAANKAFYVTTTTPASGAKGYAFNIGGPTAIETVGTNTFTTQSNDFYYNLQGQRVLNPEHGIFIHNGQKVLINK